MAVLRSILTKFGFKVEGGRLVHINKQVGAVKRRLSAATRQARAFRRELGSTANMLRYAAYAFVGSRVVKLFTKDYADMADAAAKMSKAMGISVEFYQALGHAAGISGATQEDVSKAMMQLGKRARDAREGLKKVKDAFKEMGLEVLDSNGNLKNQDVLLLEAADRFKEMKDGTAKTALAMEMFGRAGAKIIPLLNEGSDGIKAMMQEAKELGLVLDKKAAREAEEFNDQLRRAKGALTGVRNAIAKQLLPKITDLFRRFQLWYREGNNARRMLRWLKTAAKAAAVVLGLIVTVKTLKMFSSLGSALMAGVRALKLFGRAGMIAHAKLMLIFVVVAALFLAIEDLYVFAKGGDSLIGRALGDSKDAKELRSVLLEMGKALKYIWRTVRPLARQLLPILLHVFVFLVEILAKIIGAFLMLASKLGDFFLLAEEKIRAFFAAIAKGVTTAINKIKQIASGIAQAFTDAWEGVKLFFSDLGKAIDNLWSGFVSAIKTAMGIALKILNTIIGPLKWITEKLGLITGPTGGGFIFRKAQEIMKPKTGVGVTSPLVPMPAIAGAGALGGVGRTAVTTNMGGITVNVKGTANMNAPEFKRAVKTAVKDGIKETVRDAYRDLKPSGVSPVG